MYNEQNHSKNSLQNIVSYYCKNTWEKLVDIAYSTVKLLDNLPEHNAYV